MHEWGLTPSEWEREHPHDQARMMAYVSTKRNIEGYQHDWYKHKADQQAKANENK